MINILFVCLGNICRSPMAEFLLKDIVQKKGISDYFYIASAGTSAEETGNPVHKGTRRKLASYGISCDGKYARQLTKDDYFHFDYILTMEEIHIYQIERIIGAKYFQSIGSSEELGKIYAFQPDKIRDKLGKVHRLLDFSDNPRDIADPWYTGNFEETYDDILEGLNHFLNYLEENNKI